jgi:hypothetical protein
MEQVVPWSALLALIEEHYPKGGKAGRPPIPAAVMLRIHFLQQWYAAVSTLKRNTPTERSGPGDVA